MPLVRVIEPRGRRTGPAYVASALMIGALIIVRPWLTGFLGTEAPFLLFILAVLAGAWLGGLLPGLFATAAGAAASTYFFVFSLRASPHDNPDQLRIAIFLVVGSLVSALIEALHRSREAAELRQQVLEREARARRQVEGELREERDRLELALTSSGVSMWDADLTTGRIRASEHLLEDIRRTTPVLHDPDDWLARLAERVHPDDRAEVLRTITDAYEARGRLHVVYRHVLPDDAPAGEPAHDGERWTELHGRFLLGANGEPVRVIGVMQDVTQRMRREEQLRQSTAVLDAINAGESVLIFLKDRLGRMQSANQATLSALGLSAADVIGRRDSEFQDNAAHGRAIEETDQRIMTTGVSEVIEEVVDTPRGEMTFLSSKAAYRNEQGEVSGLIGVAYDITARKRAENALKELSRRKDEFLAVLAHELRNPLSPIVNAASLLRASEVQHPLVGRAARLIERHSAHMVHLIDDLLDVARIESGRFELRRAPSNLETIVRSALDYSRPLIEERGHRLETRLPSHPVTVDVDDLRLVQVITNLLQNAAVYTPAHGDIVLEVAVVASDLVIRVRDSGEGIAPHRLDHIFEMFERGAPDAGGTVKHGGLGIGLALVRQIVTMHGGHVAVTSEGPGRGSEFTAMLTGAVLAGDAAPAVAPETMSVSAAARRILAVDDNTDLLDSLATVIALLGHDVRTANDGEQAIAIAEAFRPELVLMDVGMPRMSGYDVAREMRRHPWCASVVLVAMTGWGRKEDRDLALEAGFDLHAVKPLDLERLREIIEALGPAGDVAFATPAPAPSAQG